MFNGLNVFCDVDFEVIRGVGWGEGSTLHGRAWRSEKAGACWGIKIGSRAKLWCFAAVGAGLSLESVACLWVPPARRTPEDGPFLAPAAASVSAPRFPAPASRVEPRRSARRLRDLVSLFRLQVRPGKAGRAGGGRPPCPARSSPSRPPARRPRETAARNPCEEEEEAAAAKAPPPWRASRPGGLRRTHGGFLARAVSAGRRPPGGPALGPFAAAALALGLRVRGGRAVAEPGPHQDPFVRQHGQRAGAAGRRRHRAPCGAPGPRRRYAAGHRAQVRSHGEQGAPRRRGPAARAGARGGARRTGGRAGGRLAPAARSARSEGRGSGRRRCLVARGAGRRGSLPR